MREPQPLAADLVRSGSMQPSGQPPRSGVQRPLAMQPLDTLNLHLSEKLASDLTQRSDHGAELRRPPSSNRSDGGVYNLADEFKRMSAVEGSIDEWHALAADSASEGIPLSDEDIDLASVELDDVCWADLPDGILREVMRHMPPSYLRVMRLVCRSWAEFAGRHTSSLKPEKLDGLRLSQRFPHLRTLDLSHCQHMIVHPKQNELRLQSSLTDASLAYLAPLKHLRHLSLRGCNMIEGSGLRHITCLPSLRTLDLTGCVHLTNKGLEHVAALKSLTHLNMRECRLITNDGLRRLEPLVQLKTFSMSNCTSVSDKGLHSLSKLSSLEQINISRCNYVTDRGFSTLLLSQLPHLKRVVVRKCPGVTENGLREIAAQKAATDGCRLELPMTQSSRGRAPPSGPFVDAWLHQGFGPGLNQGQLNFHNLPNAPIA